MHIFVMCACLSVCVSLHGRWLLVERAKAFASIPPASSALVDLRKQQSR
jgi:hypothetical protein